VWGLGHAAVGVLAGPVQIEEKVDGSQFSFMHDRAGQLHMRSKGKEIFLTKEGCTEKMFNLAAATVQELQGVLLPGAIYRCEYLRRPKHNMLAYGRVPNKHLIVYDVSWPGEIYAPREKREEEVARIGLESVPVLESCNFEDLTLDKIKAYLDRESVLGGCKVEGIVIKAYGRFVTGGQTVMVKHVSEAFKEKHGIGWREANPGSKDIVAALTASLRTERRWEKAVEHLRDEGALKGELSDIGRLIEHVKSDISEECVAEIKEALYKWAMPKLLRGAAAGLPDWYKRRLSADVFAE
jgi:hypothetical protein